MLQAHCHKLPPGPGQACGTHHPSNYLQAPSSFSPKKLPEWQAGCTGPDLGLEDDLHPSAPGWPLSSEPDSQASMEPTETPANSTNGPGGLKAVLGVGQGQAVLDLGRNRAEDQLGMSK